MKFKLLEVGATALSRAKPQCSKFEMEDHEIKRRMKTELWVSFLLRSVLIMLIHHLKSFLNATSLNAYNARSNAPFSSRA